MGGLSRRNKNSFDMSKAMSKRIKQQEKERKEQLRQAEEKARAEQENTINEPLVELGKTNKLVFFRQYNTYQALLEIHSSGNIANKYVYAKVILYIMRWFRDRLRKGGIEDYPAISFLKDDYPMPEDYAQFDLSKVSNINGFDFIDFETAFLRDKKAWVVCLSEPDNGQERSDIQGRTFTTEICVYKQKSSVVLGIREACREPENNSEDATGYRPGFVRDMFYDDDFIITEQGLDTEFAFAKEPYKVNGKSSESCNKLYDGLIVCEGRQMPILFVPGDYYEEHRVDVDKKTASLVGYCHVVVWENNWYKLFEQTMENDELVKAAEKGQLIFYRTNSIQEYDSDYYPIDSDDVLDTIKNVAHKEPLRKYCDFKKYSFKPSWWKGIQEYNGIDEDKIEELSSRHEAEISDMKKKINDLERDNDTLHKRNETLEKNNKKLNKALGKSNADNIRLMDEQETSSSERDSAKDDLNDYKERFRQEEEKNKALVRETKERYLPVVNLPSLSREDKKEVIDWIDKYYSDVLVVHPNAEKAFLSDKRNIDIHRLCMMIHYVVGYTKYRNDGGLAIDDNAAREHDVQDAGYRVEPTGSGQGSLEMYKDKYTIEITENGENKYVLLDLHLKYGKGGDSNMLRIYFYYSSEVKKSFIGYMPDHLPTRKDAH